MAREIETQQRKIIGGKSHVDMVHEQTDYDMVRVALEMVCCCIFSMPLFMCGSNYVIKMEEKYMYESPTY